MRRLTAVCLCAAILCGIGPARGEEGSGTPLRYQGEEVILAQQTPAGGYFIVTRLNTADAAPEHEYAVRFLETSGQNTTERLRKSIGYGSRVHVISGTLTLGNEARTNNKQVALDADLFIWIEGQASYVYLFHTVGLDVQAAFEQAGGTRARFDCQDVDGDGRFEILEYDSTWHIQRDDTKQWAGKLKDRPLAKLIYKYDGTKYLPVDLVPDLDAERQ
jgi:hypothetical protein